MTLAYLDSQRLSGLSGDTKPDNVPVGMIFIETDTGLRYFKAASHWHLVGSANTLGGWKEVGRTTLGGTANEITVTGLPDKRYYQVLGHSIPTSSTVGGVWRMGNGSIDTSNYAWRRSLNGAGDSTGTSAAEIDFSASSGAATYFTNAYFANLSGSEKLINGYQAHSQTTGVGTDPTRSEYVGKWVNTSNPIDQIQMQDGGGSSTFASGSEVIVLGWDPTDTHTASFWTELDDHSWQSGDDDRFSTDVFSQKKYLWVQAWTSSAVDCDHSWRVGNTTVDGSANYASRKSINGAADATIINNTTTSTWVSGTHLFEYHDLFIINVAAQEKLAIGSTVAYSATGAGTAPERVEYVWKWGNTSNQIDILQIIDENGNDMDGGQIKVWGAD